LASGSHKGGLVGFVASVPGSGLGLIFHYAFGISAGGWVGLAGLFKK
jgi:hypothetical protein